MEESRPGTETDAPGMSQQADPVSNLGKLKIAQLDADRSSPIIVECAGPKKGRGRKSPADPDGSFSSCTQPKSKQSTSEVVVEMPLPTPLITVVQACRKHLSVLLQMSRSLMGGASSLDALNPTVRAAADDQQLPVELRPLISELAQGLLACGNLVAKLKRGVSGDDAEAQSEVAHLQIERAEMDEVIQRYEQRIRAMNGEMKSFAMEHMSAIQELQLGITVRDALLNKLNNIVRDITATMNESSVPVSELRILFSSHANLPARVESELHQRQGTEESVIMALGNMQQEMIHRHHEVRTLFHEFCVLKLSGRKGGRLRYRDAEEIVNLRLNMLHL